MTTPEDDKPAPRGRPGDHAPFSWQEGKAMDLIIRTFTKRRCRTALAMYWAFTDTANDEGGRKFGYDSRFEAYCIDIAKKVRMSISSVERYARDFRSMGLLEWKSERRGALNLPNVWILLPTPVHNTERTPVPNSKLQGYVHNSELQREEGLKKYILKKGKSNDFRNTEGAEHIGDLIKRQRRV